MSQTDCIPARSISLELEKCFLYISERICLDSISTDFEYSFAFDQIEDDFISAVLPVIIRSYISFVDYLHDTIISSDIDGEYIVRIVLTYK
jgi:hypothetical protein